MSGKLLKDLKEVKVEVRRRILVETGVESERHSPQWEKTATAYSSSHCIQPLPWCTVTGPTCLKVELLEHGEGCPLHLKTQRK